MNERMTVLVRGAGELGSAAAVTLHRAGFRVLLSERPDPLAIRRTVCFSDAVFDGRAAVEGIEAHLVPIDRVEEIFKAGAIALVLDDPGAIPARIQLDAVVDARMLKRADNLKALAPISIGLGPGCMPGLDCDAVIETMRGHDLGRVLWNQLALPDTGMPGDLGGETIRRVVYSPAPGQIDWRVDFGSFVIEGEPLGEVGGVSIPSPLAGVVRGLISPHITVEKGTKIADVDPRTQGVDIHTISDKARCVGRGVLEALLEVHQRRSGRRT